MINPSLHVNKVFIEQVEKLLRATFHENEMDNIRYFMRKKGTWVIAIIMLYDSKSKTTAKVYRVLSCLIYSLINNYVCIDYLCCK